MGFADADEARGGNPTVGTLPMTGDDDDTLDQAVALRGRIGDIRPVVASATGDGSIGVVPLPNGEAWVRFYGDVRFEISLATLAELDLQIWAGFDGGGMVYAFETVDGLGSPRGLLGGYTVTLDPIHYANRGLLDEPVKVRALHRTGERTSTRLRLDASRGVLVVNQDV